MKKIMEDNDRTVFSTIEPLDLTRLLEALFIYAVCFSRFI